MSSIVIKARDFATDAHESENQRRKYTNEPYINHPRAVAALVETVTDDPITIAAAWLHDVVEDTRVPLIEIEQHFGVEIAGLVCDLTNVAKLSDGNRKKRKEINRAHSAKADPRAKTVKLADIIHNLSDLKMQDPQFAMIYAEEKRLQLTVLTEGHPTLYQRADILIQEIQGRT